MGFLGSEGWVKRHSGDKAGRGGGEARRQWWFHILTIGISVVLQVDLFRLCKTSPQRLEAATLSARARLAGLEIVCPSLLEPAVRESTAISEVRACVAISTRGSTERALGISIEWPQGLTWRSLTVRRKCGETQRLLLLPSTWRARVPPARRLKVSLWVRKLTQASPHPRQRLATIARPVTMHR